MSTRWAVVSVLRSDEANYTVRLKEPIEEQDGFVWLPYELVDRRAGGTDMLQEVAVGSPLTEGQYFESANDALRRFM